MNIISYLSEYDRDLHYKEVIVLTVSVLDASICELTKYTKELELNSIWKVNACY